MAPNRRPLGSLLVVAGLLVCAPVRAADAPAGNTALTPSVTVPPASAPLVGLDSGSLALAPPGSASAARNDGLAGSPPTGVDLSYIPAAERDSYLNSHDFADHLQTSTRGGHHPSALSQLGGAAEGMAINGALLGIEGLTLNAR
jgi:hypothetical protein